MFQQANQVLFSNESGTFLYVDGNLYQYEWSGNSIVANLLFKDLPCTGVMNVMQERGSGDYFISTESTGFHRIKRKRFTVINLKDANGKPVIERNGGNNSSNVIYALTNWDGRHLYCNEHIMSLNGAGFSRHFDPRNAERISHFFIYPKDSTHVWLNMSNGIYSLDKTTGRYTQLIKIFSPKKIVELGNGTSIVVAIDVIAALQNGKATELYSSDTVNFTTAEKISDNCLVIGSAKGIFYFYPTSKKLEAIPYEKELKVRYIFKDRANRLWFTTYGQGLFYLSGKSILPIPPDKAGYLSIGHSIAEDNSGYFWVPTNHGLFKFRYDSLLSIIQGKSSKLNYTYFDKTDGFNTNEFNGGGWPALINHRETGRLFFPSMDGIVTFSPDSIKSVNSSRHLFFDEIVLNDTGMVQTTADNLLFSNRTKSIRLVFSSPYYGHPQNIRYSYSISSEPEQWQELGNSRSIVLNNLPGGRYTVTVKKEEADNIPVLARIEFAIEKKFTETLLFRLLLVLAITGLVFLYFKARLFYLNKERNRLEKEVALRTADQLRLIDELKNSVTELTQLQQELSGMMEHRERIVGVLMHDIKSPLRFLNQVAAHLANSLVQNEAVKNKNIAREIAVSLNQLYLFVQDFAVWLGSTAPGKMLVNEKIDLQKMLSETVAVYAEVQKNISIRIPDTTPVLYGDTDMIKAIIRNLLDNAVKNTTDGRILLSVACPQETEECEITISDEGKGLPEEQIAELNRYFLSEQETLSFSADRSGHKIIKDFLQKQGGYILYQSNNPRGLIATVTLPGSFDPQHSSVTVLSSN